MNEVKRTFLMPDIGEGLTSGEIIQWYVKIGDEVEVDQPAVVIETVKATVELPLPYGGKVLEIFGNERDVIPVGAPLITLLTYESASEGDEQVAHLVGRRRSVENVPSSKLSPLRRLPAKRPGLRIVASPAVRKLARDLAVDLEGIIGTGKGNAITIEDVRVAAAVSLP